jgi:hypothetical protein
MLVSVYIRLRYIIRYYLLSPYADYSEKFINHIVHNLILLLLNEKGRHFGTSSTCGVEEIFIKFSSKFIQKNYLVEDGVGF